MIDGELVTIIVNLLLVGGFLWWMLHPRHNNNEEPPVPKPLPKTGKMRCPMCGAEAKVTGKQWGAVTAVGSNKVWVQKQPG